MKTAVGLIPPGQKRRRIASGTKIRSQSRDGLSFRSVTNFAIYFS
jgi:hypothetical protein